MSKTVVSSISCSYGSITGNVSRVSSSTTTVSDQSDLDSLERRINSKIQSLEDQVKDLKLKNDILSDTIKNILSEYKSLSSNLVSEIKGLIAEGNDELRDILNNEME